MENKQFEWTSFDNLKLFAQVWKPSGEAKAVINLVHGMGEHSGRYEQWATKLCEQGFAIVSFDLRGHGLSEGQLGHSPAYHALLNDIDLLFAKQKELFPSLPVFLYGHSLGGNLVLNYVLRRVPDIAGVIATSPWLKLNMQPPKILLMFAKVMRSIVPTLSQNTNLDAGFISRDANEVARYKNDKLIHGKITVSMFLSIVEAGKWALNNAHLLTVKSLIMHGTGDKITSYKASEEFVGKSHSDAHLKLWENAYHELHHEAERQQVFDYLINWLK